MSGNTTSLNLSERINLGVPTNDIEAISMLDTCTRIAHLRDADYGEIMRFYIVARKNRDACVCDAYLMALDSLITHTFGAGFHRLVAYKGYVARGGVF